MTMNEAFRPLLDKCVIVYLDDILIYSPDRAQHLQDIEAFFKILSENRLLTKASKCEFLQDRLEFLGHIISGEGVEIDPKKSATIQAWHAPKILTKLQSFLGLVNYVRRFVPDMAKLTAPLTDLLRKGQLAEAKGVYYVKTGTNRIRVPAYSLLRELLLQEAHDGVTSGHFRVEKTRQQLQRYYYWPELLTDVQHHVGSCPTCQVMKSSQKRRAGQLQPIPLPERAWQQVTMDFVTGLSSNPGDNDAVMVVVDRLTKMAHFAACKKSISAEETARLFIAAVVRLHGIPAAIISDCDTKFTSNFWKNLWEQFRTRLQFSSSYHPETDGQMEWTNQTMEQLIRVTCNDPTTWEQQLPLIEFAYNNAMSATTHQSPCYLNYGQNPTVPMMPSPDNPTSRAQQFAEILQAARTRAAEAIKKANVIAKRNADRHCRPVTYQSRDYVLLDTQNLRLLIVPKLRPRYCGPFQISHMITPITAHLLLPTDWYINPSFHVSLLRPYIPSTSQLHRYRPPSMTRLASEPIIEPEKNLSHRIRHPTGIKRIEFLVR
ncbi:unnamed protein product [Closterium sp. NIES-54]